MILYLFHKNYSIFCPRTFYFGLGKWV